MMVIYCLFFVVAGMTSQVRAEYERVEPALGVGPVSASSVGSITLLFNVLADAYRNPLRDAELACPELVLAAGTLAKYPSESEPVASPGSTAYFSCQAGSYFRKIQTEVRSACEEYSYHNRGDDDDCEPQGTRFKITFDTDRRSLGCKGPEWSGPAPACTAFTCPIPTVPNGEWNSDQSRIKHGDVVTITCDRGYLARGQQSIKCSIENANERDGWNLDPPSCKVIKCAQPKRPEQSIISFKNATNTRGIGAEIRISCRSHYILDGSSRRKCMENGRWSGRDVTCQPARLQDVSHCPVPVIPYGGRKVGKGYNRGDVVTYICYPEFVSRGPSRIKCNDEGRWEPAGLPMCQALFTFDDPEELAGNFGQLFDKMNETDDLDTATGRHIDRIASDGLDITFLIDSSGSIARRDFKQIIRFIKLFAEKVDVSNRSNGAQFAALSFGESPGEDFGKNNGFHTEPRSLEEVKGLLGGLKYSSGGTNIRGALVYFKQNMLPHNLRKRASANQYLFIFSDGNYNQGGNPTNIASDLRADMVEIFSVKIGSNEIKTGEAKTNTNVLITLSSEEDLNDNIADPDPHFFHLQYYATLGYLVQELLKGSIDYSECGVAGKTGITLGNIIGGNIAQPRAWPWMVAVTEAQANNVKMREHKQLCGGTLLDNEWILTAAHCFKGRTYNNPRRVMVKLGANNMTQVGENNLKVHDVEVRSMHIHEGWSANNTRRANDKNTNWANDIALLRLNSKINFSNSVRPICLINKTTHDEVIEDKIAVVTGWGITGNESLSARQPGGKRLRQVRLPVVTPAKDSRRCNSRFQAEKFICAGSERRADSCTGDSGGPLMIELGAENNKPRWYQIGIVSNGVGCAQPDTYGKYTDIRRYRDWIEDTINNAGQ